MCTIMQLPYRDNFLVVKNNDTFLKNGMIFTNNRGIKKKALILPPEKPMEWVSKYGSISFSQCGKEFPVGGMNEKGLVIEQTTLLETIYPNNSNKEAIKELQLIQYLLDTCSDVKEAIREIQNINISQATWTIQYIISDQSGNMAIIQYLNGEANIYTTEKLIIKGVTNSIYDESLDVYEYGLDDDTQTTDYSRNSLERFIKASQLTKKPVNHIKEALSCLKKVERDDTVWNIIYDPYNKVVYFSIIGINAIKNIHLADINFERTAQPLYFDLLKNSEKVDFEIYTKDINRDLVNSFFQNETIKSLMNLSAIPTEMIDYLCSYPDILYMS